MADPKFALDLSKLQLPEEPKQPNAWDKLNTPMVDVVHGANPITKAATSEMLAPVRNWLHEHPKTEAAVKFGRDLVGQSTSPLAAGLSLGAPAAEFIPGIRSAMPYLGRAMGAGAVAHGGSRVYKGISEGNGAEAVSGGLEAGLGALPFLHAGPAAPTGGFPEFTGAKGPANAKAYLDTVGKYYDKHTGEMLTPPISPGSQEFPKYNAALKVIDEETLRRPNDALAQEMFGPNGRPEVRTSNPKITKGLRVASAPLSRADAEAAHAKALEADRKQDVQSQKSANDDAAANLLVQEGQQAEKTRQAKELDKQLYEATSASAKNDKPLAQAEEKLAKDQGQAIEDNKRKDVQAAAAKIRQNMQATREQIRDQRNLSDVQDWLQKRREAGVAQASAEAQQSKLDELGEKFTEKGEPTSIRHTITGKGGLGEPISATSYDRAPEPEDEAGGGGDNGPATEPPTPKVGDKTFVDQASAAKAAEAIGGGVYAPVDNGDGTFSIAPTKPESLVEQSIRENRSYAKLKPEAQAKINPFLQKAMADGYKGDIDDLGDRLADMLGDMKDEAAHTGPTEVDAFLRKIRRGGPIFDDGSEEVKTVKQQIQQSGRSTAGVFSKKAGRSMDKAGQDLLGRDLNPKETAILDHMSNMLRNEKPADDPFDLLGSYLKSRGDQWWNPVTAEITDYTQGDVPTQDVEPPAAAPTQDTEPNVAAPATPAPPVAAGAAPTAAAKFNQKVQKVLASAQQPNLPTDQNPPPPPAPPAAPRAMADVAPNNPAVDAMMGEHGEDYDPNAPVGKPLTPEGVGQPPPNPGKGTMSVPDFAQALNAEGNKPIADVPLSLTPEAAQAPPDTTGNMFGEPPPPAPVPVKPKPKGPAGPMGALFDNEEGPFTSVPQQPDVANAQDPEVPQDEFGNRIPAEIAAKKAQIESGQPPAPQQGSFPMRLFKSPLDAAGQGYGDVKDAIAAGEAVPPAGRQAAGRAAQRLNTEFKATQGVKNSQDAITGAQEALNDPNIPDTLKVRLRAQLAKLMGEGGYVKIGPTDTNVPEVGDALRLANTLRRSSLLSPFSAFKKGMGDLGALGMAGIEHPSRIPDLTRGLFNPETWEDFKSGYMAPSQGQEERSGIESFLGGPHNPLGVAGRIMSGFTEATKGAMDRGGITPEEAARLTMTTTPGGQPHLLSKYATGALYRGLSEPLPAHFIPFTRIPLNALDRGYEYSPFGAADALGDQLTNGSRYTPDQRIDAYKKAAIGTGVTGLTAAAMPKNWDKDHPYWANGAMFAGPLGIAARTGAAIKDNWQPGNLGASVGNAAADTMKGFAREVPGVRELNGIGELAKGNAKPFVSDYLGSYTNFAGYPNRMLFDDKERQTTGKDLPQSEQWLGKAMANVPGLSQNLPEKKPKNPFKLDFSKVQF